MRKTIGAILLGALIFLSACSNSTISTDIIRATSSEVAVTQQIEATETSVLTGPIATVNALNALVTLHPSTPIGGKILENNDFHGIFNQAWIIIRDNYVRDDFNGVDWDFVYEKYSPLFELIQNEQDHWNLMTDFVEELNDVHSRFISPESPVPQAWTGLIIEPNKEENRLYIWKVCSIGPGNSAGLTRGDIITEIDGEPVTKSGDDWEKEDYRAAIFGNDGENNVSLTILQGPNSVLNTFSLTLSGASGCDEFDSYIASQSPKIGVIRIRSYGIGATAASTMILAALEDLEREGPLDGLIIDQRHNGGGSPFAASVFAEGIVGKLVSIREGGSETVFRIRGPVGWNTTTPMVVLTDGNSISAAEYFPASLRELGRATIIGMPTRGESEKLAYFSFVDGSQMVISERALFLNDGTNFEGVGVIPDLLVPLGDWGLRQSPYDVQLQVAIDFLVDNQK